MLMEKILVLWSMDIKALIKALIPLLFSVKDILEFAQLPVKYFEPVSCLTDVPTV